MRQTRRDPVHLSAQAEQERGPRAQLARSALQHQLGRRSRPQLPSAKRHTRAVQQAGCEAFGTSLQDTLDYDIFKIVEDLFCSQEKWDNMLL